MMRGVACVGDVRKRGGKTLPDAGQAYCEACKSTGTIARSGPGSLGRVPDAADRDS